jgi:hypothetical protein
MTWATVLPVFGCRRCARVGNTLPRRHLGFCAWWFGDTCLLISHVPPNKSIQNAPMRVPTTWAAVSPLQSRNLLKALKLLSLACLSCAQISETQAL